MRKILLATIVDGVIAVDACVVMQRSRVGGLQKPVTLLEKSFRATRNFGTRKLACARRTGRGPGCRMTNQSTGAKPTRQSRIPF